MGRVCHDQSLLFASVPFWQKHSCTKGLVPLALITFLSRTSSRRTSPRNQSHFYVNRKLLAFFHRVISSLGVSLIMASNKSLVHANRISGMRERWKRKLAKTSGQRLCSLSKEVERGWLHLQLTSVHADRQAVAGLPERRHGKKDETFQKIFFLGLCLPGKLEGW